MQRRRETLGLVVEEDGCGRTAEGHDGSNLRSNKGAEAAEIWQA